MNITITIENEHHLFLHHVDALKQRVMYWAGNEHHFTHSYNADYLITAFGNIGVDAQIVPHTLTEQAF